MAMLKVIEVLGNSTKSWEDATQNAVKEAAETVNNIRSAYVNEMTTKVDNGKVSEFRVNLKVTFEITKEKFEK